MKDDIRASLQEAAVRYLAAHPWDSLRDENFFGVEDDDTELDGWASISGNAGEEFGLIVYLGKDGRRILERTLALDMEVARHDELADVVALTVIDESEKSSFREGTRLDIVVDLGGKKMIPVAFRKLPGDTARALRDKEARFLERVLVAIVKAKEYGFDTDDVHDEKGGRLSLLLSGTTSNLEIGRSYDEPPEANAVLLDPETEQRLMEAPRTKRILVSWKDGSLVVFDPKERETLHEDTFTPDNYVAAAQGVVTFLAGYVEGKKALSPREIWTDSPLIEKALAPLAQLGVKLSTKLGLKDIKR